MEESNIKTQVVAGSIATLAALSGGFHNGWSSPSLVKLQAVDSDLPITSGQGAWIASIYLIACAFGGILTGITANKWGRKLTLLSTAIPFAVACILIATAQNYWWLIVARFMAGLGFGGSVPIIIMYLGEIAGDKIRGALGVLYNQMASIGILFAYCVGPWTSRVALAGVGLALPIIFAISFIWMPESPYFLVMKSRLKNAEKSLIWLRGTSDVEQELRKIEESIEKEETGTLKELIMTPANRKALVIITIVMSAPQLSGVNAILSYTGLIFEASGSELSSSISVIIIGVVQFLGGGLSLFTVDLAGRRPLLLLSFGGSIIFLLAEALYFQLQAIGTDVSSISWLPMTAIIGYVVFYSLGLGCVPFVILSEILPCNVKAAAMTYAVLLISVSGMTVTKLYQVIADAYGIHFSFYLFAACSLVLVLCVYFILPETKQKSLSVIQDELRSPLGSTKLPISAGDKL